MILNFFWKFLNFHEILLTIKNLKNWKTQFIVWSKRKSNFRITKKSHNISKKAENLVINRDEGGDIQTRCSTSSSSAGAIAATAAEFYKSTTKEEEEEEDGERGSWCYVYI